MNLTPVIIRLPRRCHGVSSPARRVAAVTRNVALRCRTASACRRRARTDGVGRRARCQMLVSCRRVRVLAEMECIERRPCRSRWHDRGDILREARLIARVLDPPATERLVQIDQIGEAREARLHQRLLRAVQTGLRSQDSEVIVYTVAKAQLREVERALLSRGEAFEGGDLVVVGAARRET